MRLNGEEFYKQFFCQFQEYVKQDRKRYYKSMTEAAWTKYVKDDFLSVLAKELGFRGIKREGIYGIDLTLEKGPENMSVAIEHENNLRSIWKSEVPNLLKAAAQLKVLITYIDDAEFPGIEVANKLLQNLREADFHQEFLLILGASSMSEPTDWVGYLYCSELVARNLVFCSQRLKAETSPGRKAAKTRREREKSRELSN